MFDFMKYKKLKKHKKYRLKPTLKQKIRGKLAIKKFKRKIRKLQKKRGVINEKNKKS